MILSSLGTALPDLASLGTVANDFGQTWGAGDGTVPSVSGFTTWAGSGDDLKIQRIHLGSLFVHLILYNYNYPSTNVGQYTIDPDRAGAAITNVPNGRYGVDTYLLRGTVLGLLKSISKGGTLDSNQVLNRDTSFAYVLDVWRSSLNLGEGIDPNAAMFGNALWATAEAFQASPYNGLAYNGINPPTVVSNMFLFMSNYVSWANAGFPYSDPNNLSNATRIAQDLLVTNMFALVGSSTWGNNTLNFQAGVCTTNN
jgi:hypothetical protein